MPLAQAITRQPLVVPVVAVRVMEPLAYTGRLRVGVDGALRSQRPRSSDIRCWTSVNTPPENGGSRQAETWKALPHWVVRLQQRARAHGRSLNSELVDCLRRQSAANIDTENWLQQVEALRAEIKGGPIRLDELVAATERDSH